MQGIIDPDLLGDTAQSLHHIFPALAESGLHHHQQHQGEEVKDEALGEIGMEMPMMSGGKRGKEGGEKIKRTRQSQSCDPCRARKVKCDRPPPGAAVDTPTKDVCSHCQQLGLECTFEYKPKKRGPPNMYIKRMQAERASSQGTPSSPGPSSSVPPTYLPEPSHSPSLARRQSHLQSQSRNQTPSFPQLTASYAYPPIDPYSPPIGPGGTLSSQNTYGTSTLATPGQGQSASLGKHINTVWDQALHRAVVATAPPPPPPEERGYGYDIPQIQEQQYDISPGLPTTARPASSYTSSSSRHPPPPPPLPQLSPSFSSPRYTHYPSNPSNPLDRILPRGLLLHIIDLYFDYLYPLIPVIHRPTFMRDIHDHREEREGQDEWIHMILVLVAATLIQVPRAFVPLARREVKELAERCWDMVRRFLATDWTEVSLERLTIQYLLSGHIMGRVQVGYSLFGSNAGVILRLRLHEEATYASFPPLERELRRRLFYLAYGGDRSVSAIDGLTTMFTEDECDVGLPSEIDDEFITETAYLEQPAERVSLLTGFNYISKIFRISGQVMDRRRRDRRTPPSGIALQMRLSEVNDLYEQIMTMMDDCPEPLRLDWDSDTRSIANFSDDWDAHASADIRTLFFDPKASRAVVKDAFLVQQANIYVTQQMVRYMTLQYRDELLHLRSVELGRTGSGRDSAPGPLQRRSSGVRRDWNRAMVSEEEKDQVAMDLLAILQKIPIQVIAVNHAPLVVKVRFVASTLLDALATPATTPPHPGEHVRSGTRTQKAQSYLWDFLRILSEIEALYSLNDDEGNGGAVVM